MTVDGLYGVVTKVDSLSAGIHTVQLANGTASDYGSQDLRHMGFGPPLGLMGNVLGNGNFAEVLQPENFLEIVHALEWYAGMHRAEDYLSDNGERAIKALKLAQ